MINKNNVERIYNKTTEQIIRFEPLFTSPNNNMVIGVSLDTDMESEYYDYEYDGMSDNRIKRGQMVMVSSPNSIDRGNRIKMSYKGKDLFTYVRTLKSFDISDWIYGDSWKNYGVE